MGLDNVTSVATRYFGSDALATSATPFTGGDYYLFVSKLFPDSALTVEQGDDGSILFYDEVGNLVAVKDENGNVIARVDGDLLVYENVPEAEGICTDAAPEVSDDREGEIGADGGICVGDAVDPADDAGDPNRLVCEEDHFVPEENQCVPEDEICYDPSADAAALQNCAKKYGDSADAYIGGSGDCKDTDAGGSGTAAAAGDAAKEKGGKDVEDSDDTSDDSWDGVGVTMGSANEGGGGTVVGTDPNAGAVPEPEIVAEVPTVGTPGMPESWGFAITPPLDDASFGIYCKYLIYEGQVSASTGQKTGTAIPSLAHFLMAEDPVLTEFLGRGSHIADGRGDHAPHIPADKVGVYVGKRVGISSDGEKVPLEELPPDSRVGDIQVAFLGMKGQRKGDDGIGKTGLPGGIPLGLGVDDNPIHDCNYDPMQIMGDIASFGGLPHSLMTALAVAGKGYVHVDHRDSLELEGVHPKRDEGDDSEGGGHQGKQDGQGDDGDDPDSDPNQRRRRVVAFYA